MMIDTLELTKSQVLPSETKGENMCLLFLADEVNYQYLDVSQLYMH